MLGIGDKPYKVTRVSGSYVDGVWVLSSPVVFAVLSSIQPVGAKDMERLPEGRRSIPSIKMYTKTKLRVAEENSHNADFVEFDGDQYEVSIVDPWQNGIIPHYRVVAVKVQPE